MKDTHEHRMGRILRIIFDAENTLQPNDTVQFAVEEIAEFAHHYYRLCEALDAQMSHHNQSARLHLALASAADAILKGGKL